MSADNTQTNEEKTSDLSNLNLVYDVPLEVSVVLGCTKMKVADLIKLKKGSVIELDKKVGEPIDVLVNDRVFARGEIVLIGGKIGITITELVKS